jgi:hypothetical protein
MCIGLLAGMPWAQPQPALVKLSAPSCQSNLHKPCQRSFASAQPVRGCELMGLQSGLRMDGLRRMLGRFGLSGHHHLQPIQKLSGATAGLHLASVGH